MGGSSQTVCAADLPMKDSLSKYAIAASDSEVERFHLATDGQDASYL